MAHVEEQLADDRLAVSLSKALLLARDSHISNRTILDQIKR